jgi:hypothetical protein
MTCSSDDSVIPNCMTLLLVGLRQHHYPHAVAVRPLGLSRLITDDGAVVAGVSSYGRLLAPAGSA